MSDKSKELWKWIVILGTLGVAATIIALAML